jgi:hypothetical protein
MITHITPDIAREAHAAALPPSWQAMDYDLWEAFRASRARRKDADPPYVVFLRACEQARAEATRERRKTFWNSNLWGAIMKIDPDSRTGTCQSLTATLEAFADREFAQGRQLLEELTLGVRPTLEQPDGDTVRLAWSAPSWQAELGLMLLLDLASGRTAQRCQACDRPFVSRAFGATYCSTRCRQRVQQRRHRARRPKESADSGNPNNNERS